jgi:Spy/CpxP family protein refolding chaperone
MSRVSRLQLLALAVLAAAFLAATANAQPPRGGPGGPGGFGPGRGPGFMGMPRGGGLVGLLMRKDVRNELKVTEEEGDQLREVSQESMEALREFFPNREAMADLTQEQRQAEKLAPKLEEGIGKILGPERLNRLKQLQRQRTGVDALVTAEAVQILGLTEEQQTGIKDVVAKRDKEREELGGQFRAMFEGGFRELSDEEREKRRKQMEELREKGEALDAKAQKSAMALLGDDQKGKMSVFMGAPFEFQDEPPAFGGGRFGRGPRGEGGPGEGQPGEGRRGQGRRGPGRQGGDR